MGYPPSKAKSQALRLVPDSDHLALFASRTLGEGERVVAGTLGPLTHAYAAERMRRGEIVATTLTQYRSVLGKLERAHGNRPLDQYGKGTIDRYLDSVGQLKPSSRASAWTIVCGFSRWLVDNGRIRRDPTAKIKAPKRPRTEPRALDGDAVDALRAIVPDARAAAIVWLELGMGLRRIEVHRLNVEDWSRRDELVRVVGKGSHERTVPVPTGAAEALRVYLGQYPATVGPLIRGYTTGRRLSLSALSHYMARWMYEAGIKHGPRDGVSGHALRHTCASDVLDACDDIRVVQELLGHADLSTTARYLRRARIGKLREAMESAAA